MPDERAINDEVARAVLRMTRKKRRPRTEARDFEICVRDVVVALRSELSPAGKELIIGSACWIWSGRYGKYAGCPFWSAAALGEFRGLDGASPVRWGDRWRHEHIVPRATLVGIILGIEDPTVESVRCVLDCFAIGCVVTLAEDARLSKGLRQTMPPGFLKTGDTLHMDPWARYCTVGIEVRGPIAWLNGVPTEP